MKLEKFDEATKEDLVEWGITEIGTPILDENTLLKNYFSITDGFFDEIREYERIFNVGTIEHVITEFDFSGATLKVEESKICITPGSEIEIDKHCNYKLIKGIYQI